MYSLSPSLQSSFDKYKDKKNGLIVQLRYDKQLTQEIKDLTSFLDDNTSTSVRVYCILHDIHEKPVCSCGKQLKFHKISRGFYGTCGNKKCTSKLRSLKITEANKHIDKVASVKKMRETKFKKYGFTSNFSGGSPTRESYKEIMKEKYGVEHPLQNEKIRKKAQQTIIQNHGTLNMFNINKTVKTMNERYGTSLAMKSEMIKNKSVLNAKQTKHNAILQKIKDLNYTYISHNEDFYTLKCNKCNTITDTIYRQMINYCHRNDIPLCKRCSFKYTFRSKGEKELLLAIQQFYNGNIETKRQFLGAESDLIIPDKKIAIEFNGIYYHSELYKKVNHHKDKKILFHNKGYNLINIWEDDWKDINKKQIILNRLKVKLGLGNKIYARKCQIKQVAGTETREFLDKYHLKGYAVSSINIGLYYNNELISICTFIKNRSAISGNKDGYELIRNCTKENSIVIGGFKKILNYFKTLHKESVYSYADCDWVSLDNSAYIQNGFKLIKYTNPGYSWCVNGIRRNRLNFTKQKLVKQGADKNLTEIEIMHSMKFYRVFDTGNLVFEY